MILDIENLKKDIGTFKLNNISFSLNECCITGFIGINGSGKTTTIKTILGMSMRDSGSIKLFGNELTASNERDLKNRIGIVLDEGYFYENLTLKEMKSIISPAYSNWNDYTFNEYIKLFSLPLNQKISTLSKGMKVKYALSLALSHEADLLIMDEPTSGLDPLVRNELMEILLDFMKNKNKSVFFSTHITSDLDKVADDIILIDHGNIILKGNKNHILDTHYLVKGNKILLTEEIKSLFLNLNESEHSFEGVTTNKDIFTNQLDNVLIERPSIEDIMLSYIGGDRNDF